MRRWREILVTTAIIGGLAAYWIGSEVRHARSILPKGIRTVRDFFDQFGEPQRIRMVEHNGQSFYEFTAQLPGAWSAALPSSAPAYVFDEQGQFVVWCRDPGEAPSYRRSWALQRTNQVEIGVVKQKFGI